jgi:hypothetical protein
VSKIRYLKLYDAYSGIKEMSVFLKEKVYEVTTDPSYTFRQKIKIFCQFYESDHLKVPITCVLENTFRLSCEKINQVFFFSTSIGYKGEIPKLKIIKIPRESEKLGFFDLDFVILNKKILLDE